MGLRKTRSRGRRQCVLDPATYSCQQFTIAPERLSIDSRADVEVQSAPSTEKTAVLAPSAGRRSLRIRSSVDTERSPMPDIPITVTPASPGISRSSHDNQNISDEALPEQRSSSIDDSSRDMSRGKKVREAVKRNVHKGQAGITKNLKKIGHNVGKHSGGQPKRSNSAPGECCRLIAAETRANPDVRPPCCLGSFSVPGVVYTPSTAL